MMAKLPLTFTLLIERNFGLSKYITKPRLEILNFLRKNHPPLADLYEGAIKVLDDPNFPGRKRLVCHAVREIRNRLPDIISGRSKEKNFHYPHLVDEIYKPWKRLNYPDNGLLPEVHISEGDNPGGQPINTIPIDREVVEKLSYLISMHILPQENKSKKAEKLFFGEGSDFSHLRPTVEQWINVTDWFANHKRVHVSHEPDPDSLFDGLEKQFDNFENLLLSLIRGIFDTTSELDEILEDTNS